MFLTRNNIIVKKTGVYCFSGISVQIGVYVHLLKLLKAEKIKNVKKRKNFLPQNHGTLKVLNQYLKYPF